jgi:preprotein translocase subunit Sec61beta
MIAHANLCMSSSGGGLMSSAGLVRYFDSEDRNAPTMDPKTIVAFGILFGVLVQILNAVA